MNEYIFYTCEGYTEPPAEGHVVENCQVLGRETGETAEEAMANCYLHFQKPKNYTKV